MEVEVVRRVWGPVEEETYSKLAVRRGRYQEWFAEEGLAGW